MPDLFDYQTTGVVDHQFESISELGAAIERMTEETQGKRPDNSSEETYGSDWARWKFDETLSRAKSGGHWPEARSMVTPFDLKGFRLGSKVGPEYTGVHDLVGMDLDMDAYMDGEPECLLDHRPHEVEDSVIRIGVQTLNPASAKATQVGNRMKALLSAVEMLEHQGRSVEIWVCVINWTYAIEDKPSHRLRLCVKQAGEAWAPEQVAFTFDAAFARRLYFRFFECFPHTYQSGYGMGTGTGFDPRAEYGYDVWLPYMRPAQWSDESASMETMRQALMEAKLLENVHGNEE